jgi:hypothetical protein
MKRVESLRKQLICIALLAAWTPIANANVFGDAWDCAKGSAEAGYELAGKGAQALEVLGSAPHCVAYATAGDIPLYATTGALFTLNAIDSSIVSSTNCVASVKSHAVVPMGQLLDGAFGGVIPANLLDAGSQEAADQLWEFMGSTPPISEAIDRVECGCTFLEAGVSVQNLVEIFTIIAQAGEKCDAALANVPGYQSVKAGVKAGGTAMNNLGEDIFTDQIQHKDVEEYYFHDFDGGVDSYATRSHAAARILDPNHNWRTQEGANFLSETVVKLGGGANNGEQYKNTCKNYFDSHKMSADNANEVCEAMVQRFDYDYKSMVARMSAQDVLVKQLDTKLAARAKSATAECGQRFPPEGDKIVSGGLYDGYGPTALAHNQCLMSMRGAVGSLEWHSPYNAVGSLGLPIDPADIDAMLAPGKPYYFMHPIAMSGAKKIAYEAFENNGGKAGPALAQAMLAYEMKHDKILADAQASYDKLAMLVKQNKAAMVKAAAGFAFPNCPTGDKYQPCLDALGDAVAVCITQTGSVPLSGEFPKPGEQAKIDAIYKQCDAGYVGLAVALAKRNSQDISMRANLTGTCPTAQSGLRLSCFVDAQDAISSCQGGAPRMTSGYFSSKLFAQDPTPEVSCAMAASLFKSKWAADDEQIGRINGATPEALKACINKVPDFGSCQTQVGALADACRADLQATANVLLGGLSLQSEELPNAKKALVENADACIAQMMAVSDTLGAGKEAEVLMVKQYDNRCLRDPTCKQELRDAFQQCQGVPATGSTGNPPGVRQVRANSGRSSGNIAVGVASNKLRAHSQNLAAAPNPVTAAMNNPSAFSVGTKVLALAKTPADVVAECSDELEAVLAKYEQPKVKYVAVMPTPAPSNTLVLIPNTGTTTRTPPPATRGGRPAPPVASPTDGRRTAPAAPTTPMVMNRLPAPAIAPVTMQAGMDRMGGDYRGFALDQADPQLCRQACADDNACRSYTYVNPGLKGPQAMCFLKNTTPPATPNDCCTSGQKQDATRR